MIVVAGALFVDAEERERYLDEAREAVGAARAADGCLDFALSADLLDPRRINVFECWESASALDAFRGSGPDDGQLDRIREFRIVEYDAEDRSGS